LSISFEDLPIVSFVNKLLPIEILYFQNCIFIFGLNTVCICFCSVQITYALYASSFRKELRKEEEKNRFLYFNRKYG